MQISTTMRCHLATVEMTTIKTKQKNANEDVEKEEFSYTVGGKLNYFMYFEKLYGGFSKNKNKDIYDSEIPLLHVYPKERKSLHLRGICTSMFIVAIFTITKI